MYAKNSKSDYKNSKKYEEAIKYNTNSTSAQGSISDIRIISGGTGYKKLPDFSMVPSTNGVNDLIVAKSNTIGDVKKARIINEGFEYSSDKTLQPNADISPLFIKEDCLHKCIKLLVLSKKFTSL